MVVVFLTVGKMISKSIWRDKDMGILGDMIRLVRDTTKETLKECGFDDLKDELKDALKALKGE